MSLFYFLFIFFTVVNIHELGHFFASRLFGVKVEEYGFGWPPRIVSKVWKGTRYSLNLLLAGGFVKIFGKDPDEKGALSSNKSFQNKKYIQKLSIMLGGIAFNLILAFGIFYVLFLCGFPRFESISDGATFIHKVQENSVAESIGLRVGDQVLEIAGEPIREYSQVSEITEKNRKKETILKIRRGSEELEITGVPDPYFGILVSPVELERGSIVSSFGLAAKETYSVFAGTVDLLAKLLTGRGKGIEVSGPVGIAKISGQTASMGARYFFQFLAALSVNLAVINLIPFPALDGGWAVLISIEAIRKKRFKTQAVQLVNTIGFAIIIGLLILVTVRDLFVK